MPIYEYRCGDCGKEVEALQKFSDPPLTDCPSCGGTNLKRLLSQSSFALKGSGWYADGYGGRAGEKKDGESAPAAAPAASQDASAEAKPEKKANDTAPASKPAETKASNG